MRRRDAEDVVVVVVVGAINQREDEQCRTYSSPPVNLSPSSDPPPIISLIARSIESRPVWTRSSGWGNVLARKRFSSKADARILEYTIVSSPNEN